MAPVLEPHSGPDSGTMLSISLPMLQIFPINSFLYSTCTQAWKQKFGMWRFIATITELTICFSNYRKLHNNIIRYFNYLDIPLKYHNGISFPISINTEWQIARGDIILHFKEYNSLFGHCLLICFLFVYEIWQQCICICIFFIKDEQ